MEIIPEEAQSKGHKFGTQHLRNPLPSGHYQPNKLKQIQSHTRKNTTHKVHMVDGLQASSICLIQKILMELLYIFSAYHEEQLLTFLECSQRNGHPQPSTQPGQNLIYYIQIRIRNIQHLRPPILRTPNQYNPIQEKTLRKKKAKNTPPIVLSSHFSFYFPFKTKIREQPMPEEKKNHKNRNRGDPTPS